MEQQSAVPAWVDRPAVLYRLVAFAPGGDSVQEIDIEDDREFEELKRVLAKMRGYGEVAEKKGEQ